MESCPRLLDLIHEGEERVVRDGGGRNGYQVAEERKLELRLAPPGGEDWSLVKQKREEISVSSLDLFPNFSKNNFKPSSGAKREFTATLEPESRGQKTTATTNKSQTTTSPASVVGWPPIRSFRKNIASGSSKPPPASENAVSHKPKKPEDHTNGMFVKINMDGIPIGRKVDLKAHDSYEKLSSSVDDLFRGLLAAQREQPPATGTHSSNDESPPITGLLDGSGEYTLVYEDNEGDRMLVGDVPWNMFVSTVKRLRVLKTSEVYSQLSVKNSRDAAWNPMKKVDIPDSCSDLTT